MDITFSKKVCFISGNVNTDRPDEEVKARAEELMVKTGNKMSFSAACREVLQNRPELALAYQQQFSRVG